VIAAAVAAAVVVLGLVAPSAAGAQAPPATPVASAVAATIEQNGWYADPGADPGPGQLAALAGWVAANPHPIAYAAMAAEPPASSQSYAYDVLDALPVGGRFQTVVVLSPGDVGIDSDYWDDGAIDASLDASLDAIRADPAGGLATLTADLVNRPATTPGAGILPGRAGAYDPYDDDEPDDGTASGGAAGDDGPDLGILMLVVFGVVALFAVSWLVRGEQYETWGDGDETSSWNRRRRYQRYTGWSSGRSSGFRSSSGSSHRSSGTSHRASSGSSGHSHRGSGGRRL
jgi:hypothetical protein